MTLCFCLQVHSASQELWSDCIFLGEKGIVSFSFSDFQSSQEITVFPLFMFQTVAECVLFYYLTKKNENYKNIVRRNYRRRGRSQVFSLSLSDWNSFENQQDVTVLSVTSTLLLVVAFVFHPR